MGYNKRVTLHPQRLRIGQTVADEIKLTMAEWDRIRKLPAKGSTVSFTIMREGTEAYFDYNG